MENEKLDISQEDLAGLSVEELVEIKVEIDDLISQTDAMIAECDRVLNS